MSNHNVKSTKESPLEKKLQDKKNIDVEAKEKVLADKAKAKKEAEEKQIRVEAEVKAKAEIEKEEEAEAKIAAEKTKAEAIKQAKDAVAKAKKARSEADKAQLVADKALAALADTQVKCIIMKKDIKLTVAVPGHPEINILKDFIVGEKVICLAFIRQIMNCGLAEYEIVEKG